MTETEPSFSYIEKNFGMGLNKKLIIYFYTYSKQTMNPLNSHWNIDLRYLCFYKGKNVIDISPLYII